MKTLKLWITIAMLPFYGCAGGNVLARYKSVTIKPHDRVALGVNVTTKKMRYAFRTSKEEERVRFTPLDPYGAFKTYVTSSASSAGDTPYKGINVFEFANPSNRPITVYFDK